MLKDIDEASELLGTLATGEKLRILMAFGDEERSLAEIAEATGFSHRQISRRLTPLRLSGDLEVRRESHTVTFRIRSDTVRKLIGLIKSEIGPSI
jgi:DNA-binding transcriptional ArsR family regulator